MTIVDKLNGIKDNQKTIDDLLKEGAKLTKINSSSWYLEPLYNDELCNIGFGNFAGDLNQNEKNNVSVPHYHKDNKEYLICVSGSVLLNIEGNFVRKLKVGDCALINPGEVHYSKPLEEHTKLIFICIPADIGYLKAFKN